MNVLSLFDGISCGQVALERAGIKVDNYYASEIDKHAIQVTQANYSNTIQLGDIRSIKATSLPNIDLIIGGSPCQNLSIASKNREGLKGKKSNLFYEYLRLLKEIKPKYFLLENVKMPEKDCSIISNLLNVEPVLINSSLVSCQLRSRFYWTNIKGINDGLFNDTLIPQPKDRNIFLQDCLTDGYTNRNKARAILESESRPNINQKLLYRRYKTIGFGTIVFSKPDFDYAKGIRVLNQTELERCQTLPKNYTKCLSRNKAASVIGNGWTVDVIVHILGFINN